MTPAFGYKDLIYIVINVVSVTALFVAFKYQIKEIANEIKSLKIDFKDRNVAINKEYVDLSKNVQNQLSERKESINRILFADSGGLNFVRHDECSRRHDKVDININNINKYLHRVDRNILIIMERLKIEPNLSYRDDNKVTDL